MDYGHQEGAGINGWGCCIGINCQEVEKARGDGKNSVFAYMQPYLSRQTGGGSGVSPSLLNCSVKIPKCTFHITIKNGGS